MSISPTTSFQLLTSPTPSILFPPHFEASQLARQYQATLNFKQEYALRSGIEGTMSQAVHRTEARHARYRGLAKVRLQDAVTAAALNLIRVGEWLDDHKFATVKSSAFARLKPAC